MVHGRVLGPCFWEGRIREFAVILGILLLLSPTRAQADHGGVHVYCNEENEPVITDYGTMPQENPTWSYECLSGTPWLILREPSSPAHDPLTKISQRPPDWSRWVVIDINGNRLVNPYMDDSYPYLVQGTNRVVVPIRIMTEAIGAEVKWYPEAQQVRIQWQETEIRLTIGSSTAIVDQKLHELDQPAFIWNQRTYVPLRFVTEAFGATVSWDNDSALVDLRMPDVTCSPLYCPLQNEEATSGAQRP